MSLDPRADVLIPPTLADLAIALERAFAFDPAPAEVTRMDARVARAIAAPRVAGADVDFVQDSVVGTASGESLDYQSWE